MSERVRVVRIELINSCVQVTVQSGSGKFVLPGSFCLGEIELGAEYDFSKIEEDRPTEFLPFRLEKV